ncbi:hypothetical protein T12_16377 [Trichinella patagoniensis]|uniref:Uncharacterized protein n=1 Tax=Trichinella patagoniensis TaxID=990121 RepID=A0A0V0Z1I2_9BILA|nr:hypothetical protein T12_16377 [Trichinella patagoniensis]
MQITIAIKVSYRQLECTLVRLTCVANGEINEAKRK